jgi:hypothetical protein
MFNAESGHFQGIRHAAAGFLGQVLQDAIGVVMGHQGRVLFPQHDFYAFFQGLLFLDRQHPWHGMCGNLHLGDGDIRQHCVNFVFHDRLYLLFSTHIGRFRTK